MEAGAFCGSSHTKGTYNRQEITAMRLSSLLNRGNRLTGLVRFFVFAFIFSLGLTAVASTKAEAGGIELDM